MSTVFDTMATDRRPSAFWMRWLPVAAALLVLYVPTYVRLAHGAWNEEHNAHGPLVVLIVGWLFWQKRDDFMQLPENGAAVTGALVFALGLVAYVLGRSLEFIYFEAFSQIPVVAGLLLIFFGWRGIRVMWFPLLYMTFLVPLPGVIVDAATGWLKQLVSVIAETILYQAGYPVARSGVILTVGQYQLLVADACSGLNSMYSLAAMGLLFMYLMRDRGTWIHNAILLVAILPIAFAANIVRVVALVLITYYLGDEAAQGFLHGFSGIVLFVIALSLLFVLHKLLVFLLPSPRPAEGES